MEHIIQLISYGCVLAAALTLGNWFMTEQRKVKAAGKPWYAEYLTIPGVIIIAIIFLLPLALRFLKSR